MTPSQGCHGWDTYAPFYDWENARTVGRRDVSFWTDLATRADGVVLELGCGTGRLSVPVARVASRFVGICLLYTSPSPRDGLLSRMPSSA